MSVEDSPLLCGDAAFLFSSVPGITGGVAAMTRDGMASSTGSGAAGGTVEITRDGVASIVRWNVMGGVIEMAMSSVLMRVTIISLLWKGNNQPLE